jgi:DNA-binding GntR family transcriptional regulator
MPRASVVPISAPRTAERRRGRPGDEHLYRELFEAIVDHRIPPGTPLPEDTLGSAFGVSRTIVRKALLRLGHEGVVELRPSRGATVARPSVEEAKAVFEARRVIEVAVVAAAVERARDEDLRAIRDRLAAERAAEHGGDRRAQIRLSGAFHRDLAAAAGNTVLSDFVGELISRTSLILALYLARGALPCSHDEHAAVLEAVERRDAAAAGERMAEHLVHVEQRLDLSESEAAIDLHALFAPARPTGPAPRAGARAAQGAVARSP